VCVLAENVSVVDPSGTFDAVKFEAKWLSERFMTVSTIASSRA